MITRTCSSMIFPLHIRSDVNGVLLVVNGVYINGTRVVMDQLMVVKHLK